VTSHWTPEQRTSHDGLLDPSDRVGGNARFDAIVVPTNRPVKFLRDCIDLARGTAIPLIVVCSKRVTKDQVVDATTGEKIEGFAVQLPWPPTNPLARISFATSTDEDILAASFGRTRDLSTKRNLGLVIARMLGWRRLMFLDDDIYDVSKDDVSALAAALNNHNVSVLIPDEYPDNSVACHAYRLGGALQGKFASAGAMGVRCNRDDLPFFPNIYNEDWFFFSKEAASHKIARVGTSRQQEYDPFEHPRRAVKEEFGDLLAEGLYTRLDANLDIPGVNAFYWAKFIESRADFLSKVLESLERHPDSNPDSGEGRKVRAAQVSIRAAQGQLQRIDADLCQRFVDLWQADLDEWQDYLTNQLPRFDSVVSALDHLSLDYAAFSSNIR
jgi:glycosyltransferase involved in cell wall biosynthesis